MLGAPQRPLAAIGLDPDHGIDEVERQLAAGGDHEVDRAPVDEGGEQAAVDEADEDRLHPLPIEPGEFLPAHLAVGKREFRGDPRCWSHGRRWRRCTIRRSAPVARIRRGAIAGHREWRRGRRHVPYGGRRGSRCRPDARPPSRAAVTPGSRWQRGPRRRRGASGHQSRRSQTRSRPGRRQARSVQFAFVIYRLFRRKPCSPRRMSRPEMQTSFSCADG